MTYIIIYALISKTFGGFYVVKPGPASIFLGDGSGTPEFLVADFGFREVAFATKISGFQLPGW